MDSPVEHLQKKVNEMTEQFEVVLLTKYGTNSKKLKKRIDEFEKNKRQDLAEIKSLIDVYESAISVIKEIELIQ